MSASKPISQKSTQRPVVIPSYNLPHLQARPLEAKLDFLENISYLQCCDVLKAHLGLNKLHGVMMWGRGRFILHFKSEEYLSDAVEKGIPHNNKTLPLVPFVIPKRNITIRNLPFSITMDALAGILQKYGDIHELDYESCPYSGMRTGVRKCKMTMKTAIPNYLKVNGFFAMVSYAGVTTICRRCFLENHLAANCTTIQCTSCRGFFHEEKDCLKRTVPKMAVDKGSPAREGDEASEAAPTPTPTPSEASQPMEEDSPASAHLPDATLLKIADEERKKEEEKELKEMEQEAERKKQLSFVQALKARPPSPTNPATKKPAAKETTILTKEEAIGNVRTVPSSPKKPRKGPKPGVNRNRSRSAQRRVPMNVDESSFVMPGLPPDPDDDIAYPSMDVASTSGARADLRESGGAGATSQ